MLASLVMAAVRVIIGIVVGLVAPFFTTAGPWDAQIGHSVTSFLNQWDSGWYIAIARFGYTSWISHAFYPGYPLVVRAVSTLFGYAGATLVVSWVAVFFLVWGIWDLSERYATTEVSWFAAMFVLWSPASIFLIAGYSASLLAALMIWSLRFALLNRWPAAVALAALASGVGPEGVLSGVALVLVALRVHRSWPRACRAAVLAVVGESGIIAYALWCWVTTGQPLIFVSAERHGWTQHLAMPFYVTWEQAVRLFDAHWSVYVRVVMMLNVMAGVVGAAIVVGGLRLIRIKKPLVVVIWIVVMGIVLSVSSFDASLDGTARYVLLFSPLYVVIAVLLDQLPKRMRLPFATTVLIISALASVLYSVMFTRGWWIT